MKWLERCLDSIVDSSIELDAYIVDNGSTDGSQEFITTKYPQFTFYQSPTNSGFGAANNIGLKYAIENDYDYVYLLNQDAWVESNTIAVLIEQQKLNPEYGILSPLQTNAEKNALDKNFVGWFSKNHIAVSDAYCNTVKDLYDTDFVMAAHWLISKDCLNVVGGFSSMFYHYGEDANYIHRARYHKFKIGIAPKVIGVHDREFREPSKAKDVYMIPIPFLIISSDINRSYFKAVTRAYVSMMYLAFKNVSKYRDICILLRSIFRIYPVFRIYRDRKTNKLKVCDFTSK